MKTVHRASACKLRLIGANRGNGDGDSVGIEPGESWCPPVRRHQITLHSLRGLLFKSVLVVAVSLAFFTTIPGGRTQYLGPPQSPALVGPTVGASMRNAAAATQAQAGMVRKGANDWGRRAASSAYNASYFQQDFQTLQFQFQMMREQFNGLAALGLPLGRPRASNAITELDAGLNIISELFTFLANQFNSGTLDRQTIVRTCRAFEDAVREWEREFKKNNSRIGLVW